MVVVILDPPQIRLNAFKGMFFPHWLCHFVGVTGSCKLIVGNEASVAEDTQLIGL